MERSDIKFVFSKEEHKYYPIIIRLNEINMVGGERDLAAEKSAIAPVDNQSQLDTCSSCD